MKITYLYHSGIAFETQGCILIVDYYQPREKAEILSPIVSSLLHSGKKIYVLSTHFHADHFDPVVMTWRNSCPDICYILSSDIQKQGLAGASEARYLSLGDIFQDSCVRVKAFGSTDEGVSFYIEIDGFRLFHAGDLNNWHWNEESTSEEIRQSKTAFFCELQRIKKEITRLDILCFPVDARLGHDYMRGPEQFLAQIPSRYFVPIHFSSCGFATAAAFEPIAKKLHAVFWKIHQEGDSMEIN